ncbi:GLPGLI family protein [Tenacibaculum todarodis]|nr:GLPGLI family protein [Tenacibaculum todarodis]
MKHLKIILFFSLVTNYVTTFSQVNFSGIVHYESTINKNTLTNYLKNRRDTIDENLVKTLDKVYLQLKPIQSKLTFNNGSGLFKVLDQMSTKDNDLGMNIAKVSAGGSKEYFYDDPNKKYLIKDCETLGECFVYPNKYLEWQLTQESKIVNGYRVFKATRSNRKVIAWYTTKIPVNFGPKGEYGLPGLILEIEIGKTIFKAKKIILNPKEKIKVKKPKGNLVTLEEYSKMIKKGTQSIFGKK